MRHPLKAGFSFGSTSGIITTLGLMVGLHSGTHSVLPVLGGILTLAIADSLSDALGMHMSEESEDKHSPREIWESTISTFLFKFVFTLTFVAPIMLFQLPTAIAISVIWGLSLLSFFSYRIAKGQKVKPWKVVVEHLIIALVVIATTHYAGDWIGSTFG